jgi:hypothetical protein
LKVMPLCKRKSELPLIKWKVMLGSQKLFIPMSLRRESKK